MFEKALEGFTASRCRLDFVPVQFETVQEHLPRVFIVVPIKHRVAQNEVLHDCAMTLPVVYASRVLEGESRKVRMLGRPSHQVTYL